MGIVSPGFSGRGRSSDERLPPGQYLVTDFPVLSAGPTPRVDTGKWELRITTETGQVHHWDWAAFRALPAEEPTVDIHCVTKWSKLGTHWRGVSLDTLLDGVETSAGFATAKNSHSEVVKLYVTSKRYPDFVPAPRTGSRSCVPLSSESIP